MKTSATTVYLWSLLALVCGALLFFSLPGFSAPTGARAVSVLVRVLTCNQGSR